MMVTDASVWVSLLHNDVHKRATSSWMQEYTNSGGKLSAPNLLLAEVGGAIARRTGSSRLGHLAYQRLSSYPFLQIFPIDSPLATIAAELAVDCQLRGADAIYVALAHKLEVPLLSWDQEQITRVQNVVKAGVPGMVF